THCRRSACCALISITEKQDERTDTATGFAIALKSMTGMARRLGVGRGTYFLLPANSLLVEPIKELNRSAVLPPVERFILAAGKFCARGYGRVETSVLVSRRFVLFGRPMPATLSCGFNP